MATQSSVVACSLGKACLPEIAGSQAAGNRAREVGHVRCLAAAVAAAAAVATAACSVLASLVEEDSNLNSRSSLATITKLTQRCVRQYSSEKPRGSDRDQKQFAIDQLDGHGHSRINYCRTSCTACIACSGALGPLGSVCNFAKRAPKGLL